MNDPTNKINITNSTTTNNNNISGNTNSNNASIVPLAIIGSVKKKKKNDSKRPRIRPNTSSKKSTSNSFNTNTNTNSNENGTKRKAGSSTTPGTKKMQRIHEYNHIKGSMVDTTKTNIDVNDALISSGSRSNNNNNDNNNLSTNISAGTSSKIATDDTNTSTNTNETDNTTLDPITTPTTATGGTGSTSTTNHQQNQNKRITTIHRSKVSIGSGGSRKSSSHATPTSSSANTTVVGVRGSRRNTGISIGSSITGVVGTRVSVGNKNLVTAAATATTSTSSNSSHSQQQNNQHNHNNTSIIPAFTTTTTTTQSTTTRTTTSTPLSTIMTLPPLTTTTPNTNNNDDIIPYQHLGQLNPLWKIPPPKNENDKPMKYYCSKYMKTLPIALRGNKNNKKNNNNNNSSSSDKNGNNKKNGGDGNGDHQRNGQSFPNQTSSSLPVSNPTNNNINNINNSNTSNQPKATTTITTTNYNTESTQDNRSGPMVEVINGEIVIKESTIIIGRRHTTEEVDRELDNAVIIEDNNALTATYRSFTTREKNRIWNASETKKFYVALRQCGTDFTTMSHFFNGSDGMKKRSRKQLKGKYMVECKKNWKLIDMAMNPKVQLKLDLSVFGELDMDNLPTSNSSVVDNDDVGTITTSGSIGGTNNDTDTTTATTTSSVPILESQSRTTTSTSSSTTPANTAESCTIGMSNSIVSETVHNNTSSLAPLSSLDPTPTKPLEEEIVEVTPSPDAGAIEEAKEEEETQTTSHIPLTIASGTKKKIKKKPKFRAKAPITRGKAKKSVK